jgi:beta-lactamase regulating signal transducer with metallopeptidase domain
MFVLRGIAVSVSIAVILYVCLSFVVKWTWRSIWNGARKYSAKSCSELLFALRLAPLVIATAVTLIFAVPSFMLLEPRSVTEPVGVLPTTLGICGVALLLAGTWNGVSALLRSSRTLERWADATSVIGSAPIDSRNSVAVLRSSSAVPPLTVAGIFRPTVWLSGRVESLLSERELQSALRHEVVHVRRKDNLRKLVLLLVAFPGMAELETAWREATEMAADDEAVSSSSEALDLAGAVIKLSRFIPFEPPAELTTGLVHSPAESLSARVERLMTWSERQNPAMKYSSRSAWCIAAATAIAVSVGYGQLLVVVHAATEWLVR